jgi:hypothetical protein
MQLGEPRRQANNNLLSFPYGDRFKMHQRTGEKTNQVAAF